MVHQRQVLMFCALGPLWWLGENHCELRDAVAGCARSGVRSRHPSIDLPRIDDESLFTTLLRYAKQSNVLFGGEHWLEQSTGDLFPKNSPPYFVFEGARHFCLTVVPQLHALLITLRTTSARLRKHLQELRRVVQILRNRHEVSAEGHQCGAGTVVSVDRHPLEQRRKAASVEGASVLGRHRARAKQRARTSFCT